MARKEPEPEQRRLPWSTALLGVFVTGASAFLLGQNWRSTVVGDRPLEVKCLVEAVKSQLVATERSQQKQGSPPLFELKDFEMEIQYVVRNSGGVKAEWLVSAQASMPVPREYRSSRNPGYRRHRGRDC